MSYLYSKLPETGVPPHIGTGGAPNLSPRALSACGGFSWLERKLGDFRKESSHVCILASQVRRYRLVIRREICGLKTQG